MISGLTTSNYTLDTTIIPDGTFILLKIHASDSVGFVSQTISEGLFLVANTPHQLSSPNILLPQASETLRGEVNVAWNVAGDNWNYEVRYNLSYSSNNGTTWVNLGTNLSMTHFLWDTSMVPDGTNYLLQVEATSSDGLIIVVVSESTFTINNTVLTTSSTTIPTISTTSGWDVFLLLFTLLGLFLIRRFKS